MQKIKLSRKAVERKKSLESQDKCLACEMPLADGQRVIRGVHQLCYAAQCYAMRCGRVTDADLISRGERAPLKTRGRKPANAYTARLLGRTDEKTDAAKDGDADV